jgi:DNA primase
MAFRPFFRSVFSLQNFELKKRQILERVDLHALVAEHVTLRRSGKRWVGLCPFHSEKTPSFTVSPDIGVFKCFGCGKGGDVFSFVQFRENVAFMEAMRLLADRAGIALDEPTSRASSADGVESVSRANIAAACAWAQTFFRSNLATVMIGSAARNYLRGRGFHEATLERFGVGLAADNGPSLRSVAADAGLAAPVLEAADLVRRNDQGRFYETFRNRVMFPIRDATGRVIGFGGRTLVDDRAKYLNTRQNALFDKGRGLYGVDLARQSIVDRGRAIVVEGYTDCMACHQAGFTETVATLGTALTESQVDLLRRYCTEVIFVFDSDDAGIQAADRAIRVALPRSVTVRLARVPEGKDPGEFLTGPACAARFSDVLNEAVDALEFTWRQTVARFNADTSDARRREAILDFVRVVSEAAGAEALDAIQKGLLVNQVAHLLRMDRDEVGRLMVATQTSRRSASSDGPEKTESARPGPPRDAEQAAWAVVLEVLLNEPGLIGASADWPDPVRIADERDRRIAGWMFESAREFGEFRVSDVLARSSDSADTERIAELAARGDVRGNYEATLRLALERIRQAAQGVKLEKARHHLLNAPKGDECAVADDDLATFVDGSRQHRHFGPRRMIRRAAEAPIPEPTTAVDGATITSTATTEST